MWYVSAVTEAAGFFGCKSAGEPARAVCGTVANGGFGRLPAAACHVAGSCTRCGCAYRSSLQLIAAVAPGVPTCRRSEWGTYGSCATLLSALDASSLAAQGPVADRVAG